jgi:hypothetical protein
MPVDIIIPKFTDPNFMGFFAMPNEKDLQIRKIIKMNAVIQ